MANEMFGVGVETDFPIPILDNFLSRRRRNDETFFFVFLDFYVSLISYCRKT